jgi:hypothetical protein
MCAFQPAFIASASSSRLLLCIWFLFIPSVPLPIAYSAKTFYLKLVSIFYLKNEDLLRTSIICEVWFFGMDHPALRIISEEISDVSGF